MPERERGLYSQHKPVQLEWLRDEVVGAPRANCALEAWVSIPCHHDDGHVRIGDVKTVENEFTRYAGQADVEQHHVWPERRHGPDRVGARMREFDGIAERCQDVVQHRRDLRLVVYDEDSAGHAARLDLIARQPARKRRPRATAAAAPIRSTLDLNRVAAYAAMKERCQSGVHRVQIVVGWTPRR